MAMISSKLSVVRRLLGAVASLEGMAEHSTDTATRCDIAAQAQEHALEALQLFERIVGEMQRSSPRELIERAEEIAALRTSLGNREVERRTDGGASASTGAGP
jgi:hypothetical protein